MNGKKFSLLTIIYLFILTDLFLFFYVGLSVIFILVIAQLSWIVGLLLGLKGQGNHKVIMYKLLSIADDPRFDDREELRGHRLKQQIRHDCLEYDFWFINKKNKKKTKKLRGGKKMKPEAIKELLAWLGGCIIAVGLILDDILIIYNVRPLWFIAFNIVYFVGDFLYFWYLKNFWEIKKAEIPEVIPPVVIS